MAIITAEQLGDYAQIYGASAGLAGIYVAAAEDVVGNYLGYRPEEATYTHILEPTGGSEIRFRARPVTAVSSLTIAGVAQTLAEYAFDTDLLVRLDGSEVFSGRIQCAYTAGYSAQAMPGAIKMAALRIGALLMAESDGNIGISGKSLPDGQSRTFVSYTNFSKYLEPLADYRIHRW